MEGNHELAPAAPRVLRFDVRSPAFKQDPLPTLARMRDAGPVIRVRLPLVGTAWMATTYDAVTELLSDHHRFVQSPAAAGNRWMAMLLRLLPRTLRPLTTALTLRDEPDHRRLRGLVDRAFRVRSIDALRPHLETLANQAADELVRQVSAATTVDLIAHFARPFPLAVILELLGLPPQDRSKFTKWASTVTSGPSVVGVVRGLRGLGRTMRYLQDDIARQAVARREGLIGSLIDAEEAGDRLTEDEMIAMVVMLLVAGHETTVHQIAGSVLTLLDHPDALRTLTADWSLVHDAVEELLRHLSFGQFSKPRFAREDVVFRGRRIRRGDMLFACLAAANGDPAVFPQPERLDLRRAPNRHVAFGDGIHYCLGAALARTEVQIALHRLFTRFPNLSLAVPRSQIRFTGPFGARALAALPVRLG
jgi:cytochrome P450